MTGVVVGGPLKSFKSTTYGGNGSILVETRRNGTAVGWYNVLLMLRNERIPVLLHATDETTGQYQFNYLATDQVFTALAYDRTGVSQGAVKTDITPMVSPSTTVLDFAGTGEAGSNSVTVSVTLTDRDGDPRANLTGLTCVLFDQVTPGTFVAIAGIVTGETTDGSGNLSVTFTTSTKSAGDDAFLLVSNTDGDPDNDSSAFAAPVLLS